IIVLCGIITGIAATMSVAAWPEKKALFLFCSLFTLLMIVGFGRGVKMFFWPPVMLVVDQEKIVTFLCQNKYGNKGYAIPWSDIKNLELIERTAVGGASDRVKIVTIALTLNGEVTAPQDISKGGSDDPQTVHLDASSGSLRGNKLLETLQRYKGELL
nr:hypothetical protein [Fodinibius sp.]